MESQKIHAFGNIEYRVSTSELDVWHFSGAITKPKRRYPTRTIDLENLDRIIDDYWIYVDHHIRSGILYEGSEEDQINFLDGLKTRGSEISQAIFPVEVQKEIWKIAAESDIFVVSTNLPAIPFEALFSMEYGKNGSFLSENCVIQRQIDIEQDYAVDAATSNASSTILYVDSELLEEEKDLESTLITELIDSEMSLVKTTTINALIDSAKDAAIIHWICEHSNDGLRLKRNVFYNKRDIMAHRFPQNCVLFMLSCAAARAARSTLSKESSSISATLAGVSGCTVVAPSSVVAAQAAVKFVLDFDRILKQSRLSRLSDIWTRLKNPLGGRRSGAGITPEECYLLWFGIYGDCNVKVRGEVS